MAREPDLRDSLFVSSIVLLLVGALGALAHLGALKSDAWAGVLFHAALFAVPLLYARLAGLRPFAANGFARLPLRQAALVGIASLGSIWILKALSDLQLEILPRFWPEVAEEHRLLTERVEKVKERGALISVAVLALAPAICEETFFRGIVFRGLARSAGPGLALAVTVVFFSLVHPTISQRVLMVFLGLYFGAVVWLTGSLWAGILAHALNNLAVVGATSIMGSRAYQQPAPLWMVGLSALVFLMAMALLALDRRVRMEGKERR